MSIRGEQDGSRRTRGRERRPGAGSEGVWAGSGRSGPVWTGSGRSGPVWTGLGKDEPVWTGWGGLNRPGRSGSVGRFGRPGPGQIRLAIRASWCGPGSGSAGPGGPGSGLAAELVGWLRSGAVCAGLARSIRGGPSESSEPGEGWGGTIPAESTQRESFTFVPPD